MCPFCFSTFIEEIGTPAAAYEANTIVNSRNVFLTEEQTHRMASAAIMLRLLEAQLRDELLNLSLNHAAANARDQGAGAVAKTRPMTQACLCKLRKATLDLDLICSQPSCPVCSEDFVPDGKATQLPCSHLFHEACVLPWLDAKRTCPICRFELTDAVPAVDDLEKFSESELHDKLIEVHAMVEAAETDKGSGCRGNAPATASAAAVTITTAAASSSATSSSGKLPAALAGHTDLFTKPRRELAAMLHGVLTTQKAQSDAAAAAADAAADAVEDRGMSMLRLLTTGRADRPTASTLSGDGLRRVQSERVSHEPRLRGPSFTPVGGSGGRTASLASPHGVRIDSSGAGLTGGVASRLVYGGGRGSDDSDSDDVSDDDAQGVSRRRREEEQLADLRALRRDVQDVAVDRLALRAADEELRQEAAHRSRSDGGGGSGGPPNTQQRYIVISSGGNSSGAGGNGIVSSSASYSTLPLRTPQMPRHQPSTGGGGPPRAATLNELD